MSIYNHTPHSEVTLFDAKGANLNAPLGQLDAAIGDLSGIHGTPASVAVAIGTADPKTTVHPIMAAIAEVHDDAAGAISAIGDLSGIHGTPASVAVAIGTADPKTTAHPIMAAIAEVHDDAAGAISEVAEARGGYGDLDTRLDMMVAAGGNISTQCNGGASAGQYNLPVDATTGFIAGAYVVYALTGGALQYNQISSIDPGVKLVLTTVIGSGGIADNAVVAMISASEYAAANIVPHGGTFSPTLPASMGVLARNWYDITAFGAVSGTVCDSAIQACIDAAEAAGGKPIFIPAGVFLIENPLEMFTDPSGRAVNMQVFGTGRQSIIRANAAISCIWDANAVEIWRATFMDCMFDGNKLADRIFNFDECCTHVEIKDCVLESWLEHGIYAGDESYVSTPNGGGELRVEHCRFDGDPLNAGQPTGAGIYIDVTQNDNFIHQNIMRSPGVYGIYFATTAVSPGSDLGTGGGSIVDGNQIYQPTTTGIRLSGNIRVIRNQVEAVKYAIVLSYYGRVWIEQNYLLVGTEDDAAIIYLESGRYQEDIFICHNYCYAITGRRSTYVTLSQVATDTHIHVASPTYVDVGATIRITLNSGTQDVVVSSKSGDQINLADPLSGDITVPVPPAAPYKLVRMYVPHLISGDGTAHMKQFKIEDNEYEYIYNPETTKQEGYATILNGNTSVEVQTPYLLKANEEGAGEAAEVLLVTSTHQELGVVTAAFTPDAGPITITSENAASADRRVYYRITTSRFPVYHEF